MKLEGFQSAVLAAMISGALLLGAFAFQYIGDLPPCKMCIWQRWPHGIAIFLGLLLFGLPVRPVASLGFLVVLVGAGIAFFHAGVEQLWWEGPSTCTSGSVAGMSTEDLLDQIMNAPLVRCDEIPWSLFGLSMAAWNGVISLVAAGLWLRAALRT